MKKYLHKPVEKSGLKLLTAGRMISAAAAFTLLFGTAASIVPLRTFAATNLDEVRATNPTSGLIPISIHPAKEYDRDQNYWVKTLNDSFERLKEIESDPEYQFTFNYKVEGDPWDNYFNGVSSNNFKTYYRMYNWLFSFEGQVISNIAQLVQYTSNYERKSKNYAVNQEMYDQLVANIEQLQNQIPEYKNKLDEIERYLNWLKSLSSDDLKRYYGEFDVQEELTIHYFRQLDNLSRSEEHIELGRYNMDLISRMVFGRDDLPELQFEPGREVWEESPEELEKRTLTIAYCDDKGLPYGVTTKTDATLTTTIIVDAPEDYHTKFTVLLDGKLVAAAYDEKTGTVSAPVTGLSLGKHTAKVYVTSGEEEIVPGADEQDIPPFPVVQWSFEVKQGTVEDKSSVEEKTIAEEEPVAEETPASEADQTSNIPEHKPSNDNVKSGNKSGASPVVVDFKQLKSGTAKPLIKDKRTLVPIRAFFEGIGADLKWDKKTQTVTSTLSNGQEKTTVTLQIDSPYMYTEYTDAAGDKQNSFKKLDVVSQVINGSTYIPIRAAAEAFGYKLNWNANTSTATLTASETVEETGKSSYPTYVTKGNAALLNDFEREVFIWTNKERVNNGKAPFILNVDLSLLARKKSQDMLDNRYFDHQSPTFGSPFEMMSNAGFEYMAAAENIASGQRTPKEVVEDWMNSPGHRANILHENLTEIGIGFVKGASRTYWTQQFITP